MGAPLLQEDAGDRDLPCRVEPLQSSTAFVPACVVDQHPYSCTNLVGHCSHAWKTSGARFRWMNPVSAHPVTFYLPIFVEEPYFPEEQIVFH